MCPSDRKIDPVTEVQFEIPLPVLVFKLRFFKSHFILEVRMELADYVRIVWWSMYLVIGEPLMIMSVWRFWKHRTHGAIADRFPSLCIIALLSYPLSTITMALARILPAFPCFILIWQDFMITYVTFLVWITRTFILFFRYEWVHERLQYFRKEKELMEATDKAKKMKQLKVNVFYHNHRHWMDKSFLLKTFMIWTALGAIVPLYYSINSYNVFRTLENGDICDRFGWGTIVSGVLLIYVISFVLFAFRLRKAQDIHNIRKDLKDGICVVALTFIIYSLSSFTNQFGISQRFPVSTFVSGLCCIAMTYVGAWRPVNFALRVERTRSHSSLGKPPTSKGNGEGSIAQNGSRAEIRTIDSPKFQKFHQFVSDPVRRAAFEGFLMKAFAIENLCFFDSILQYEELFSNIDEAKDPEVQRSNILAAALNIFKQYVTYDAVLMVNISYDSKRPFEKAFLAALKAGNLEDFSSQRQFQWHESLSEMTISSLQGLYEKPFNEVLTILVEDLFRKFKSTPEYKTCSIGILDTPESPRSPALNRQPSSQEFKDPKHARSGSRELCLTSQLPEHVETV
jgi:hypothetical protein